MEFPKDSGWHSPKGPFREALERRALPLRLRFVSKFPLGELPPSAERRRLSLVLEPAASHAPTDLTEMVLAPLSGHSPAPVPPDYPFQVQDHGASTFPVSVLDARDCTPLHDQKRRDRLSSHSVAAPWGFLIRGDREPKKQTLSDASCCMKAHTFATRAY